MTVSELVNRILFLVPDAKCAVWDCSLNEYMGEAEPIEMDGKLICWNGNNSVPCPSFEDIEKVNKSSLDEQVEQKRKDARNIQKAEELSLVASFDIEKKSRPQLSFGDYLDELELKSDNLKRI